MVVGYHHFRKPPYSDLLRHVLYFSQLSMVNLFLPRLSALNILLFVSVFHYKSYKGRAIFHGRELGVFAIYLCFHWISCLYQRIDRLQDVASRVTLSASLGSHFSHPTHSVVLASQNFLFSSTMLSTLDHAVLPHGVGCKRFAALFACGP